MMCAAGCLETSLGSVSLVGAGPGDPELLTVKAVKRIQAAEVVLHDALISEDILALIPKEADLINVGKRCGMVKDRGLQQQEIHELLLAHSRRGKRVVRLKGGDPFVFGRGGEELEFLAGHGVDVEIVPGITAALGVSASCHMPLTHRGHGNTSIRIVVGQAQDKKASGASNLNWPDLARDVRSQTTVFYMGLRSIDLICSKLLENGAAPETPIAVVESGTTPKERVIAGTIASLPELLRKDDGGHGGPAIILLGNAAAFPAQIAKLQEAAGACGCDGPAAKRARRASPGSPCDGLA